MKAVKRNILLTPGPATTTDSVKYAQLAPDICPREQEFGNVMEYIRVQLTQLAAANSTQYTTVLFGGSGTAAVESILSSVIWRGHTLVIINNGAYGERMCQIAEAYGLQFIVFNSFPHIPLDLAALQSFVQNSRLKITHLAVVHHETTTGLLNDIDAIGAICKKHDIEMIVDAISSFAAIPIRMEPMNISYLAASSNKNIQGMPGVSFVIAETVKLEQLPDKPKNYYLNLYAQHKFYSETGQMRFTPPVQTLYALKQAIDELTQEGIENRYLRYAKSWETLIAGINRLGLNYIGSNNLHSKLVTSIFEPEVPGYNFKEMHDYFYSRGFTIYPGKVDAFNTFRIANIGDITYQDMEVFLKLLEKYLKKKGFISKEGSTL